MGLGRFCAVLGLAAFASGCGGIIDPSKNTIDTFSGTLAVGGTNAHVYSLKKSGEVTVTMTSLVPSVTNGSIGVGIGQSVSGSCAPLSGYVASGIANRAVEFGVLNKGDYCVLVFDPGVLTASINYAGTFSHP